MSLRVQCQRLAILGQMDGQLRHPQDRIVNPDKPMADSVPSRTDSLPLIPRSRSSQELSQAPPYGSSATTRHAGYHPVRMLLDPQVGTVGVRADDSEAAPRALGVPGDQ